MVDIKLVYANTTVSILFEFPRIHFKHAVYAIKRDFLLSDVNFILKETPRVCFSVGKNGIAEYYPDRLAGL